jgi:7-carboxy-7-deazaguanine synthase
MALNPIPVLEVFGPTIQGEGMVVGQKTMFVRTAGCDYSCVWCDSAFTWDGSAKEDIRKLTAHEIVEELFAVGGENNFSHVTISGGNPALIPSIGGLIELLHEKGIRVAIETQGSRWQDWFTSVDELTLSPKPPSSKMETNFEKLDEIVNKFSNDKCATSSVSLKIVVFNDKDFEYAKMIHSRYPSIPFYMQVGNEDTEVDTKGDLTKKLLLKYEWLVEKVLASPEMNDTKVLPQLHSLLWGNKRGV